MEKKLKDNMDLEALNSYLGALTQLLKVQFEMLKGMNGKLDKMINEMLKIANKD